MSLRIYTDMTQVPSNIEVITCNDVFFDIKTELVQDDVIQKILLDIDRARYAAPNAFFQRNSDIALSTENLSTGCKTVINIYRNPEKCFFLGECGDNAKEEILHLERGNVLDPYPIITYSLDRYFDDDNCDIIMDGKHYTNLDDLFDHVRDCYKMTNIFL